MTILETIRTNLLTAIKAKETNQVSILRGMIASLTNEEKKLGKPLTEDEEFKILFKIRKDLIEEIETWKTANRLDRVQILESHIGIVSNYLPIPLSESEVEEIIEQHLQENNEPITQKSVGKFVGMFSKQLKNKTDGATIKRILDKKIAI